MRDPGLCPGWLPMLILSRLVAVHVGHVMRGQQDGVVCAGVQMTVGAVDDLWLPGDDSAACGAEDYGG